jgi:hypothetical protein
MKLLIIQFLQTFLNSSFLRPNIFFSALFGNTLNHCSANVNDKVPRFMTKILYLVLYGFIFLFDAEIHRRYKAKY